MKILRKKKHLVFIICTMTETRVLPPGPNSWVSSCQVQPLPTIHQIKTHIEGQRKRFITGSRTYRGKRQGKHSAHLEPSSVYRQALVLNRQRTGGRRREVRTVKQSQSQVWSCRSLSQCLFLGVPEKLPESLSPGRQSVLKRLYC
jgi:hypothetical protein